MSEGSPFVARGDRAFMLNWIDQATHAARQRNGDRITFQVQANESELSVALDRGPRGQRVSHEVVGMLSLFADAVRQPSGRGSSAPAVAGKEGLVHALNELSEKPHGATRAVHFDADLLKSAVRGLSDGAPLSTARLMFEGAAKESILRLRGGEVLKEQPLSAGRRNETFRFDRRFFAISGCDRPDRFAPLDQGMRDRLEGYGRLLEKAQPDLARVIGRGLRAADLYAEAPSEGMRLARDFEARSGRQVSELGAAVARRAGWYGKCAAAMNSAMGRELQEASISMPTGIVGADRMNADVRYLGHHLVAYEQDYLRQAGRDAVEPERLSLQAGRTRVVIDVAAAQVQVGLTPKRSEVFTQPDIVAEMKEFAAVISRSAASIGTKPGTALGIGDHGRIGDHRGLGSPTAGIDDLSREQILSSWAADIDRIAERHPEGKVRLRASQDELQHFFGARSGGEWSLDRQSSAAVATTLRLLAPASRRDSQSVEIRNSDVLVTPEVLKAQLFDMAKWPEETLAFSFASFRETVALTRVRDKERTAGLLSKDEAARGRGLGD